MGGLESYMEEKEEEFKPLTDWLKETYGSKVSKVTLSSRLENSPMIIPTGKYGQTANMERITAGQAFGKGGSKATTLLRLTSVTRLSSRSRSRWTPSTRTP